VVARGVFVTLECHIVRFYPLQGCISIRISATPSKIGDDLIVIFKRRKFNFILCYYDNYMDDIDYFVVKA
jgi:hypothetical protein